jgi:hypothetical protein
LLLELLLPVVAVAQDSSSQLLLSR